MVAQLCRPAASGSRECLMQMIRKAARLAACALVFAACGGGDDETVRDDNGNIVEGGEVGVFALNIGDCFVDMPAGDAASMTAVPCAEDHLFEVYHLFDVDMEEFDSAAIDTAGTEGCLAAFEPYMGVSFETSYYNFEGLQPSAGTWAQGDREVVCLATPFNGSTTAGTAKGAGLVLEQAAPETPTTTAPPAADDTATTAAGETATTIAPGGSQSVFDLNVGECYVDLAGGDQVESIEPISCDEPHGIEIMAVFDIDLPAYDLEAVSSAGEEGCLAAFESYMGISYEESWYELDWLQPSTGSWDGGDREIVCVVFPYDEAISESVGSAQGTGRLLES